MEWLEGLWECLQHLRERYIYSAGMPSEPDTHGVDAVRRELPVVVGRRCGADDVKGLLDHECLCLCGRIQFPGQNPGAHDISTAT